MQNICRAKTMRDTYPCLSIRIFLVVFAVVLIYTCSYAHVYSYDLNEEFLRLYKEIVDLSKKGIDVSYMVNNLSAVLEIAEQYNVSESRVDELMRFIRNSLEEIKKEASRITLYRDITRFSIVIFLASMPIVFYVFFPRLYLYTWFITRRRWVVKSESTR